MIKIVTIIGARPQFIKAASLSREIKKHKNIKEVLVHTGQHFDKNMSDIFFNQMHIPKPKYNLNINNLSHGMMTGKMIAGIEKILIEENPNWLLVYGDTNSTLAGAIAAIKLKIKVIHVEAGLRSFNTDMPEEINRILTDRVSSLLFCSTKTAMNNLKSEGYLSFNCKFYDVGDIMYDSAKYFKEFSNINPTEEDYILMTLHRAENTDIESKLKNIFKNIDLLNKRIKVKIPLHPRTKKYIKKFKIKTKVELINPVGYVDMLKLIENASCVITDSGGLQKEAYFFKKQCFTLRNETEWSELVELGYNTLINVEEKFFYKLIETKMLNKIEFSNDLYGDGNTAAKIIHAILDF